MSEEKRKVNVKISDLIDAFEMGSAGNQNYLDLETGTVILNTRDNIELELDEILEEFDSVYEGSGTDDPAAYEKLVEYVKQCDIQDWVKAEILQAIEIENGFGTRYIAIPWVESYEGYQDMELFIDTVEDEHVRELLSIAIDGRGAFRRFKDVLYDHLDERERWFAFKQDRMRQRVLDWLDGKGIEAIE